MIVRDKRLKSSGPALVEGTLSLVERTHGGFWMFLGTGYDVFLEDTEVAAILRVGEEKPPPDTIYSCRWELSRT